MVCYGGDGTLLEGVHRLDGEDIPVVGINGGHLGFLALAPRENVEEVFDFIAAQNLHFESRAMLQVEGVFEGEERVLYALNEVAVQRLGATMISIIKGGLMTSLRSKIGALLVKPALKETMKAEAKGLTPCKKCW